jgi:hypothetical protein
MLGLANPMTDRNHQHSPQSSMALPGSWLTMGHKIHNQQAKAKPTHRFSPPAAAKNSLLYKTTTRLAAA